jgi:hypothetical protein
VIKLSFLPALALIFITLKLMEIINWSWWLVLLPIYGPAAFFFGIAISAAFMAMIIFIFSGGK